MRTPNYEELTHSHTNRDIRNPATKGINVWNIQNFNKHLDLEVQTIQIKQQGYCG